MISRSPWFPNIGPMLLQCPDFYTVGILSVRQIHIHMVDIQKQSAALQYHALHKIAREMVQFQKLNNSPGVGMQFPCKKSRLA